MQNTRIFLHFSLIQVCASLWGCLPSPPPCSSSACSRATSTPFACTQVAHKLLANFSRGTRPLFVALLWQRQLPWTFVWTGWGLSVEFRFGCSLVRGGLIRWKSSLPQFAISKKEIYLYCTLSWLPGTSRWHLHSLVPRLPLPISVFQFAGFCQFNFLVYFTFQFKWRQIAGPLASCSICILRQENYVNNFYSQSFAF